MGNSSIISDLQLLFVLSFAMMFGVLLCFAWERGVRYGRRCAFKEGTTFASGFAAGIRHQQKVESENENDDD